MTMNSTITTSLTNFIDKYLINIPDPIRKKLIGDKVDQILSKYLDRISSEQLANILLSRYSTDVFNTQYQVFETVINRLDEEEVKKVANFLGLNVKNDVWDKVINVIPSKKKELLNYFNLPEYFLLKKEADNRKTYSIINNEYNEKLTSLGYPHPYQNSVKLELQEKIKTSSSNYSSLIVMPTGSGKTRTAIEFMIDFIRDKKSCNILWAVESPELAEQSLQSFNSLWKLRGDRQLKVQRCFGRFIPEINSINQINIVFAGFDKLISLKKNKHQFYNDFSSKTDLLIIDEAHFSLAETYESLISDIKRYSENLIIVGLTATPMREDDDEFMNLKHFFLNGQIEFKDDNNNHISDPINYLQEKGYLAKIIPEYLKIDPKDIDQFSEELNNQIINRAKISIEKNEQIIVFAMSKDHAIALNILFKYHELKSECIVGETLVSDRQEFFKQFKDKKINILVNYSILSTGIDLPKVDLLILARKFQQYTTAMQVVGRALRGEKNGGNKTNTIVSIINNSQIINDPSNLYNLINNMH